MHTLAKFLDEVNAAYGGYKYFIIGETVTNGIVRCYLSHLQEEYLERVYDIIIYITYLRIGGHFILDEGDNDRILLNNAENINFIIKISGKLIGLMF